MDKCLCWQSNDNYNGKDDKINWGTGFGVDYSYHN